MEDCCAVCAEPLEWVAYGSCGHREVCSTCVVRLRFVLNDRRCCLCKIESQSIFVTKALGDYTRTISDFSTLPSNASEGQVGEYWYHEDTQSYFDDVDHYRMIKAMCRLSCSVCDKHGEEQGSDAVKRRSKFRNIEQLKGHLYHRHRLVMCNLCLEGRKIFICEQKLYTKAQLNQHINTGDSEVDGDEIERGGFSGHPMCEFCRNPFYGDNELYLHMSTEHYTCHICQRRHPGQYEYYRNYDDLEIHFRNEHFLCENEECLVKKFVVFQSEAEMKRHNAIEHGGHMSRSKRNAALQIPTSFRYRHHNERDQHRGRGRGSRLYSFDNQLSLANQASTETANADNSIQDSSSTAQPVLDHWDTSDVDAPVEPFESLAITSDLEPSSRYLQAAAAQSSRSARLEESSFPPLSGAPGSSSQIPRLDSEGPQGRTMAARLRRKQGTVNVISAGGRPIARVFPPSSSAAPEWPAVNHGVMLSSSSSSAQARPATVHGHVASSSRSSVRNLSSTARVSHSASAPNLVDGGSSSSFLPSKVAASGSENQVSPAVGQHLLNAEAVQTANKSLVERIRVALDMDDNKYAAFKEISAEYRKDQIGTPEYLAYVQQFGLSHLVLELARLCPDAQKQRELVETYNASLRIDGLQENGSSNSSSAKGSKGSRKGKDKCVDGAESKKGKDKCIDGAESKKHKLADDVVNTVRNLQANYRPSEEVEVLSKDGYRAGKGRSMSSSLERAEQTSTSLETAELSGNNESQLNGGGSNQNLGGGGSTKQRKKASKFHRLRLGDASAAALLNLGHLDASPEHREETAPNIGPSDGLPVRGVWRNGGGQKLVALTQKGSSK